MAISENEHVEVVETVPDASPDDLQECLACAGKFPNNELIALRCVHRYCRACMEKIFETALKDETMFPPKCCGIDIRTKRVQTHISTRLVRMFKARQPELSTRNRTYCHRARCSAFIAPHSIHNGQAFCQKCGAITCSKCRKQSHFGACLEGEDAAFFELIRSTDWKRCPECKRMVEKNDGCDHIMSVFYILRRS